MPRRINYSKVQTLPSVHRYRTPSAYDRFYKVKTTKSKFTVFWNATSCNPMCVYIHTYIHIYIHTYIHTHIHIYIQVYIYIYTHTHTHRINLTTSKKRIVYWPNLSSSDRLVFPNFFSMDLRYLFIFQRARVHGKVYSPEDVASWGREQFE